MHDNKRRRKFMPSRKQFLYPKHKISRKKKGGNDVIQGLSSVAFSSYGIPRILGMLGMGTAGPVVIFLANTALMPIFTMIYKLIEQKLITNTESLSGMLYFLLPTTLFTGLMLSLKTDFSDENVKNDPLLQEQLNSVTTESDAERTTESDAERTKNDAERLRLAAEALRLAEEAKNQTKQPSTTPVNPPQNSNEAINTLWTDKIKNLPTELQNQFNEFSTYIKKLLSAGQKEANPVQNTGSSTSFITTKNVITVAMIGFLFYYIKTRLSANKEENEKLNKKLTENERRRLLIARYKRKMTEYDQKEQETDIIELKELQEKEQDRQFSELAKERLRKKPKTPEKKPPTPQKRPPTPEKKPPSPEKKLPAPKVYRPEFKEGTDQFRLNP